MTATDSQKMLCRDQPKFSLLRQLRLTVLSAILSIAFLLGTFIARAQVISPRLFTGRDGLVATYVFSSYQDKLGYLWVCTTGGISRFDGKTFTNYGLAEGLPDTRVIGAFMDSRKRLWAFTTRGVAEFRNGRFLTYPLADGQVLHWVSSITETADGRILSLTNQGIYQFDGKKWRKASFYPGYDDHPCVSLLETVEGTYISYGDLVVLKKPGGHYLVIGRQKEPSYFGALSEVDGSVFLKTAQSIVRIANGQLIPYPGVAHPFKSNFVFLFDRRHRLWTAESGNDVQQTGGDQPLVPRTIYKGPPGFLVQGIMEDRQGNIWLATANGLLRFSDESFQAFNTDALFGNRIIWNLIRTPSGALLVNDGRFALSPLNGGPAQPLHTSTPLPNNEFIVDDEAVDQDGDHWYEMRGFFLVRQHGHELYRQSREMGNLKGDVLALCFDRYRKRIAAAIVGQNAPCTFDGRQFRPLLLSNSDTLSGFIMHLLSCTNGNLLFSTNDGKIYAIDTLGRCRLVLNEFEGRAIVRKLTNDPSGDIWINYNGHGLRRYRWTNGRLAFREAIGKAAGLDNDVVSDACFDKQNNLWVATNSGVAVFSSRPNGPAYRFIRLFNATDLHIGDEIDTRLRKDEQGDIWLFSARHLIHFYADRVKPVSTTPPVQLENIELGLQPTDWGRYTDSLSGLFGLPARLTLRHDNNSLGFFFRGIDISGTEGIRYSYQLQGFRSQWSEPSTNDFVSFIGLPPGHYVFLVRAQLNGNGWGAPASFAFEIRKAFYQTWWFYALLAFVAVSVTYLVFRYRLAQKMKLMEMRNRFSRDLHDEIGSSVSGIHLLSQMALEKMHGSQTAEAQDYLVKVRNYTGDVIEKLSDMVWIFNPQNDSLEKLVGRLKVFALTMASPKGIKVDFDMDRECANINLSIRQRKAVYLIGKEAINNAIKYSGCGLIRFQLKARGPSCILRIADDGSGFDREAAAGNGLINMQARADEVGAHFTIRSAPGAGTVVSLVL